MGTDEPKWGLKTDSILASLPFQITDADSINSIWQIINLLGAYKYKTLKAAVGDYKDV